MCIRDSYYLDREYQGDTTGNHGGIGRVDFVDGQNQLAITRQPSSTTAAIGQSVEFDVLVTGEGPFSYQWSQDNAEIDGATSSILTVPSVAESDDGALFTVEVTDGNGASLVSNAASLTVTANNAPAPFIDAPDPSLLYTAGVEYDFSGGATDPEDGIIDEADLSWSIVFLSLIHI